MPWHVSVRAARREVMAVGCQRGSDRVSGRDPDPVDGGWSAATQAASSTEEARLGPAAHGGRVR